jgi:hypothetical protein
MIHFARFEVLRTVLIKAYLPEYNTVHSGVQPPDILEELAATIFGVQQLHEIQEISPNCNI